MPRGGSCSATPTPKAQIDPRAADLTPERAGAHEKMQPVKPSLSADPPYARPPDVAPDEAPDDELTPAVPPSKTKPGWAVALEWALLIVSALVIALLIKTFLFQAFYIPSDSMVPTLKTNDRVIVNKLSYHLHPVHRGDIVVFKSPPNVDPSVKDLVKRVIALPGETVEGRADGHIYINGKVLKEPYLPKGGEPRPRLRGHQGPARLLLGDGRQPFQLARLALLPRALHPQEGHRRARVPADLAAQPARDSLT